MRKNVWIRQLPALMLAVLLTVTACGAKEKGPTWQEQYDLGVRYLSEGNYEEAILAFTAAIEIDPRPEAYNGRAQAYVLSGETEEHLTSAQADFEAALALDDSSVDAWLGLADVYIRQGDYDKALEVLQEALEKTGNDQAIQDKIAEVEACNITDSSGKLRRTSRFDADGVLLWYHEFTYDENGRQSSITHRDAAGNELGHIDLVYDANGNHLVNYGHNADDGTLIRTEAEYDGSGKRVKETHYNIKDGSVIDYMTYQYDGNGKQVRWDVYMEDGTLSRYCLYDYDDQGRDTKVTYYNPDGAVNSYITYEYDEAGRLIRDVFHDADGAVTREERNIFDDKGNDIRQETYDGDGNLMYSTTSQ